MVQLLIKDLRIQKRFIGLGFLFVGFFFFLLGAFEGLPLAIPAAIFSHFLIVMASKMDEKNNNGRMLVSFPVRRKDIVTSKYVGIFMFMALAFFLTTLWRLLAGFVLPAGELPWFDLKSMVVAIAVLLLFYSIYFPMFFAFGTRIVQMLDFIVIFAVGGAGVLALRVMEWAGVNAGVFIGGLLDADLPTLSLWTVGGGLALLIVSWTMSVFLFERKNV
ncbi:ABC-2 transporter permease [Paenibacillus mesophilus]|uniref:ABC-2 transporter permease n=1 Tax=Paenibacillus mesophilus TaxID=2582849 RepID=UPI00110E7C37|nr:ABC-2 transporter permease [Paenibacillus mesophilus]TMV46621.1 ABC-2 transporter permease [Paenibacillus mesophilus]